MRVSTRFISVCLVAALIMAACSSGDSDSSEEDHHHSRAGDHDRPADDH